MVLYRRSCCTAGLWCVPSLINHDLFTVNDVDSLAGTFYLLTAERIDLSIGGRLLTNGHFVDTSGCDDLHQTILVVVAAIGLCEIVSLRRRSVVEDNLLRLRR